MPFGLCNSGKTMCRSRSYHQLCENSSMYISMIYLSFPRTSTHILIDYNWQVRFFLGMAGWYCRYIRNFSDVAAPITDLMKHSKQFTWTVEADDAFKILNDRLTTAPALTHPDFNRPFYIECDASILGVGGVERSIQSRT